MFIEAQLAVVVGGTVAELCAEPDAPGAVIKPEVGAALALDWPRLRSRRADHALLIKLAEVFADECAGGGRGAASVDRTARATEKQPGSRGL